MSDDRARLGKLLRVSVVEEIPLTIALVLPESVARATEADIVGRLKQLQAHNTSDFRRHVNHVRCMSACVRHKDFLKAPPPKKNAHHKLTGDRMKAYSQINKSGIRMISTPV
jgi:hypothetical protein